MAEGDRSRAKAVATETLGFMVVPSASMTRSVIGLSPMHQRSLLMVKLGRQRGWRDEPAWHKSGSERGWPDHACVDGSDAALASQPVQAGPRGLRPCLRGGQPHKGSQRAHNLGREGCAGLG